MTYGVREHTKAVVLYRLLGSLAMVSEQMGLAYETLKAWKRSEWWAEKEEEIRLASRSELSGNLKKIVDKAINVVEDRLEHGDFVYDQKTGKISRKPVGAHTANAILSSTFDRTLALEKLQNAEAKRVNTEAIQERLLKLALDFERFARSKTINEGEDLAIYDKREEGLQERGQMGREPQGESGPEGGSSQSSSYNGSDWSSSQGGQQAGGSQSPAIEGWSGDSQEQFEGDFGTRERELPPEQGRIDENTTKLPT